MLKRLIVHGLPTAGVSMVAFNLFAQIELVLGRTRTSPSIVLKVVSLSNYEYESGLSQKLAGSSVRP